MSTNTVETVNFKTKAAILCALLAAFLYGASAPFSKLLLKELPPLLMASALYLGAGFGMLLLLILKARNKTKKQEAKITKKELPFVVGMILLDIAAPIFLLLGLQTTISANVSLLNNFEIAATSLIALVIFKETIGRRMWLAIALIMGSSILLSVTDFSNINFSFGSVLVLAACICWGFENNCTRMLSLKDPMQIVIIKGVGSGTGSLLIAYLSKQLSGNALYLVLAALLGFVAYGLSIYFYIRAQRGLGASRTSAYYAAAPFIGVLLSWLLLDEKISTAFSLALLIMLIGTYLAVTEKHAHSHLHQKETHEHKHNHSDGHHNHIHDTEVESEHTHKHTHEESEHTHAHTPDMHHHHTH